MPTIISFTEPSINSVICPNCRAVVAAGLFCSSCNRPLTFEADRVAAATAAALSPLAPEELVGAAATTSASVARTSVGVPLESVTSADVKLTANMDPRLQRLVVCAQQGIRKLPTSSTSIDEVAVVAKVTDVAAWEGLSEVEPGTVIEPDSTADATWIVTGRIPVSRIEEVRKQGFVVSLKPGQKVSTMLASTTNEIGATPASLPNDAMTDGGRNAIIGIVDFGCDYAHGNLRNSDGTSRILKLWDQSGPPRPDSPIGYGREYTKAEIDGALKQPNPYSALGYAPARDTLAVKGTHGTHVTDIAAGNGAGSGVPGVAPNADIVFVEIKASDIPWDGPETVGKSFGDSVQLLEAITYIFETAGSRPCVVNLSLGTNGGPHDGTTLVEEGIDRLLRNAPNRAVVIAAANSFADGIHAVGTVTVGGTFDLVWDIKNSNAANNELELWYDGNDRLTLEVIGPNGASLLTVPPGESKTLSSGNRVVLLAANRLNDSNNHDNMIGVFLEPGLPVGQWTMRLHGDAISNGGFHAWIERDDNSQSSFLPPHDNSYTLGSISCGKLTIVVGSYDAHKSTIPLSYFSSAGPTRDGRNKPEISAPGHNVLAAHSRTGTRTTKKSGTSMAAPAVTGVVALMLSEAVARGASLTADQIRDLLIGSARRNPPSGTAWESRFGNGRVSASASIAKVIALSGPPSPTSSTKKASKTKPAKKAATGKKSTAVKASSKKPSRKAATKLKKRRLSGKRASKPGAKKGR